ncbi:MAG: PilZ domain-containing protein [Syntrophorhabdaceae bacterium]|nr:PilZ domain-containing protein [Syntrophorhabdaceae bacterium]
MKKDLTICFRTSDDLRTSLEKIATDERRSLSSIIETILYDFLKQKKALQSLKKERRRYPRKPVSFPTFVYKSGSEEQALQPGTIVDISLGGIRILIPYEAKVDEAANIGTLFTLPNEKIPLKMHCAVNRVIPAEENIKEVGASFVDSDFASYQKLQNYLVQ